MKLNAQSDEPKGERGCPPFDGTLVRRRRRSPYVCLVPSSVVGLSRGQLALSMIMSLIALCPLIIFMALFAHTHIHRLVGVNLCSVWANLIHQFIILPTILSLLNSLALASGRIFVRWWFPTLCLSRLVSVGSHFSSIAHLAHSLRLLQSNTSSFRLQ